MSNQFDFKACLVFLIIGLSSCDNNNKVLYRDPLRLIYGTWKNETWSREGCSEEDVSDVPCGLPGDEIDCFELTFFPDGSLESVRGGVKKRGRYLITDIGFHLLYGDTIYTYNSWNFGREDGNLPIIDGDCRIINHIVRQDSLTYPVE